LGGFETSGGSGGGDRGRGTPVFRYTIFSRKACMNFSATRR
jgi:hypothetical protein